LRAAAAQARDWVDSPQETATRLLLLRAGYAEPRTNHRVWDEVKRKEYYLDLSYPERKVAIEYDGAHHFTPEQARQDHGKDAALHREGWTVIRILAEDLDEPATFFAQLDAALRATEASCARRSRTGSAARVNGAGDAPEWIRSAPEESDGIVRAVRIWSCGRCPPPRRTPSRRQAVRAGAPAADNRCVRRHARPFSRFRSGMDGI